MAKRRPLVTYREYSDEERAELYARVHGPKKSAPATEDTSIPEDELKRTWREISIDRLGGVLADDPESGEAEEQSADPLDHSCIEAYLQAEETCRAGSPGESDEAWRFMLADAQVPAKYHEFWMRYVNGTILQRLPGAFRKFLERLPSDRKRRARLFEASMRWRVQHDPGFGDAVPEWKNANELHRTKKPLGHAVSRSGERQHGVLRSLVEPNALLESG